MIPHNAGWRGAGGWKLASVNRGQDLLNILSGTGLPACHLHPCNVNSAKAKNAGLRKMAVPFIIRILFICSPLVVFLVVFTASQAPPPVAARAYSLVVVCGPPHCGDFSCCRVQALWHQAQQPWPWGQERRLKAATHGLNYATAQGSPRPGMELAFPGLVADCTPSHQGSPVTVSFNVRYSLGGRV